MAHRGRRPCPRISHAWLRGRRSRQARSRWRRRCPATLGTTCRKACRIQPSCYGPNSTAPFDSVEQDVLAGPARDEPAGGHSRAAKRHLAARAGRSSAYLALGLVRPASPGAGWWHIPSRLARCFVGAVTEHRRRGRRFQLQFEAPAACAAGLPGCPAPPPRTRTGIRRDLSQMSPSISSREPACRCCAAGGTVAPLPAAQPSPRSVLLGQVDGALLVILRAS